MTDLHQSHTAGVAVHKDNADLFGGEIDRIEMAECQSFFAGYDAGEKSSGVAHTP